MGTGWSSFAENGAPLGVITTNDDNGINDSIEFRSNAENFQTNFNYFVNFYETAATTTNIHQHTGFFDLGTSTNEPYAYNMIDDLDGSDTSFFDNRTTIPWVVRCEDSGGEVIHQLKIYFREWNTLNAFEAFRDSNGVTYDPHVTGAEGINCPYDPFDGDENCNDRTDFQDIVNGVGGSYDVTTPNEVLRSRWFPNIKY